MIRGFDVDELIPCDRLDELRQFGQLPVAVEKAVGREPKICAG
jgi:hypothetical protein